MLEQTKKLLRETLDRLKDAKKSSPSRSPTPSSAGTPNNLTEATQNAV